MRIAYHPRMPGRLSESTIPWTRYWIPRETAPELDRRGYLDDPETVHWIAANPDARTLEQLEEKPCVALLGEPGSGKSYMVSAYAAALRVLGWSRLAPLVAVDPCFGREVFFTFPSAIHDRFERRWAKRLETKDAAALYVWLAGQFPPADDPQDRGEGLHAITPRHMVAELRDSLLVEIGSRGTPEAVAAIEHFQQTFPDHDFTWSVHRARETAAQGTWTPRTPREIIDIHPRHAPRSTTPATPTTMPSHQPPTSTPLVHFPPPIVDAYEKGKLAVLFGSDLSLAPDVEGNYPKWKDVPARLIDHIEEHAALEPSLVDGMRQVFAGGGVSLVMMLTLLDALKQGLGEVRKYRAALGALFRPQGASPGDVHFALAELGLGVLLRTNYDQLFEMTESSRQPFTWRESSDALSDIEEGRQVLFKIHGTAERDGTVVLTKSEYAEASADLSYQRTLSYLLQSYTFLLVGYGINDPLDLDLVFELNDKAFGTAARTHYALMKDASQTDRDRWQRELNIHAVPYQDHGDIPAILRALRATKP